MTLTTKPTRDTVGLKRRVAYPLILPAVLFLLMFGFVPFLYSVWQSFLSVDLQRPRLVGSFAGLDNYLRLFGDRAFFQSLITTIKFISFGILIEFPLGFGIAAYLQQVSPRLRRLVLTALVIPMVIAPVSVGMIWKFLMNPQYGVLTYYSRFVGINLQNTLSNPVSALWAVRLVDIWQWTPFTILLFQACLSAIPRELLDAAAVDGLSAAMRYRYIVLPSILPTMLIAILLRLLESFKVFDSIFVLTEGGPGNATEMVSLYANRTAFVRGDYSYAAADVVVLNLIVFSFCSLLLRVASRTPRVAQASGSNGGFYI
jgi:multiple sugar transport system permease protein